MFSSMLLLILVTACTHGVTEQGGQQVQAYEPSQNYQVHELRALAPLIVKSSRRDPPVGKQHELFTGVMPPVRKFGVLVFESIIQPTRGGLTGEDKIYLSLQGKQLLTEKLLSIWDQALSVIAAELQYLPHENLIEASSLRRHGSGVPDYLRSERQALGGDDVFFAPSGQRASMATLINPRGLRDLSLLSVPAAELMGGPKYSEHHKHLVNEVCRELGLDGVLIVLSELSWSAGGIRKSTGEATAEAMVINLSASLLIPFDQYHQRLKRLGRSERPMVNVSFSSYQASLQLPVSLSLPPTDQNFHSIETQLLNPLIKSYNDLAQMMMLRLVDDLRTTH
jgi:hypothetical protein